MGPIVVGAGIVAIAILLVGGFAMWRLSSHKPVGVLASRVEVSRTSTTYPPLPTRDPSLTAISTITATADHVTLQISSAPGEQPSSGRAEGELSEGFTAEAPWAYHRPSPKAGPEAMAKARGTAAASATATAHEVADDARPTALQWVQQSMQRCVRADAAP